MIRILVNDWMTSMGVVALLRIDEEERRIIAKDNYIQVPLAWLETLPERLFHYILEHFSVADREFQALKKLAARLPMVKEDKAKYKENTKWMNNRLKGSIDKIRRDFSEYSAQCESLVKELKQAIEQHQFDDVHSRIESFYHLLKQEKVDQKFTLNWVKSALFSQVAGQASFLNVSKNKLTFDEQLEHFRVDYITPLLWELKLRKYYEEENEQAIEQLFEQDEKPDYTKSWIREKKKSKMNWCEWLKQLPECTLLENQWGTLPFEELHFVPLGVSSKNFNFAWNGDVNTIQPISSLAKLILFLSPFGANQYRRTVKSEQMNVFGFLYDEASCEYTLNLNNRLANSLSADVIFSEAIKDSFGIMKVLEERRIEAVLVEWATDYSVKKTFLEYQILRPDFVKYLLSDESKILSMIFPYTFREEMVRAALNNIESKHIILREMRQVLGQSIERRFTSSLRNALLMREYLIDMKEEKEVEKEKTITSQMYALGFKIAKRLGTDREESADVPYQASSDKKITSMAYRLMNAAKAGNRELFYDTAFRLHIAAGMKISSTFVKGMDATTSDRDFATIALAFVAGLTPTEQRNTTEHNNEIVS